ncbi:CocE/NonD family hydrolase [Streptomyces sp. NPDC096311]|uniref:CocE/NonD family hydrolase n=1 Tax=Streptomyces sp. NPDC096311 TaxID=3366083 RepID=UPI00380675CB
MGERPEFHRPKVDGVAVDRDVRVPMRDGVHLCADVYRPEGAAQERHPVLLAVSPYQKDLAGLPAVPTYPTRETGPIEWYVQQGYVYVLADVRGTGKSDGRWEVLGATEQRDLYDLVEWAAEQPWSTGRVGMIGQSYFAMLQWLAAIQRPPHLACIAPYDASIDEYREAAFHGGIPSSGFITLWSFAVRAMHAMGPRGADGLAKLGDVDRELLEHPTDDDFWRERSAYWRMDRIDVPVFSIGNWGKHARHLRGNILGFELVTSPKRLYVEAGARPSQLNVAKALTDYESTEFHERLLLPWYDHWLRDKDSGIMTGPAVRLHVSGTDEERAFDRWPPPGVECVPYYLTPGPSDVVESLNDGGLSTTPPEGSLPSTSYHYPQAEWHVGTTLVNPSGVPNQVARILTFTSAPLDEDVMVIGPVKLVLYASSDQSDTDFIVRLTDQEPDGTPRPEGAAPPGQVLTRGWLKASHRAVDPERSTDLRPFHTHRDPQPLEPGEVYRFEVEVLPIGHVFRRGHRIRLELANGDSPMTEGIFTHFYGVKAGVDTVHHDAVSPSHLLLPVVRG